jgi:hypothetical protein
VTCVRINLLHSFFKGRRDQKTADAIIAIAVSMAVAEKESVFESTDGMVQPSFIREKINKILEESFFNELLPDEKN